MKHIEGNFVSLPIKPPTTPVCGCAWATSWSLVVVLIHGRKHIGVVRRQRVGRVASITAHPEAVQVLLVLHPVSEKVLSLARY